MLEQNLRRELTSEERRRLWLTIPAVEVSSFSDQERSNFPDEQDSNFDSVASGE
jgi:hypothetical protein